MLCLTFNLTLDTHMLIVNDRHMPNGISGQSQRCTARLFIVGVQCMWATVKDCTIKLLCSGVCFVQPSIARCLFHSACLVLVFSRARLWSDNQSLSRLFAARLNYWLYVKKVNVNSFSYMINACNSWFIVPNNLLKLLCFEKYISNIFQKLCSTTANGGSLGSLVDEERS